MITLALETASPTGGVALLDDERLLASQVITSSRAHSRLIMPTLETMLRELGLTLNHVDVVAVSRGPGTFTGVRVAFSLAKAFCLEERPRLVLVPTMHALALRAYSGEPVDAVLALLNARRGEVYGAVCRVGPEGSVQRPEEEFAGPLEAILQRIGPARHVLAAGEGAIAFRADLEAALAPGRLRHARLGRNLCSPEEVALLGREMALRGEFADPATAAPTYLRPPTITEPRPRSTLS